MSAAKAGREAILGAVRAALGRDALSSDAVAELDARDSAHRRHTQPAIGDDSLATMRRMMARVQMGLTELDRVDQIGAAVADFLRQHQLPPSIVIAPEIAELPGIDWPDGLEVRSGGAVADDLSSLTGCIAAIAETGSVVMDTRLDAPASLRFLPDNHLVVLRRDQVVDRLEDALALVRSPDGKRSRGVHINTGPSRTGDVEQVIEIGAHGPRRMHVFLIG